MSFIGSDIEQLDRAAAELRAAADELDGHCGALTSVLGSIDWAGDLASRFLSSWTGGHRVNLTSTSRFFRDAADDLARNANEQRQASTSDGGGGRFGRHGWQPLPDWGLTVPVPGWRGVLPRSPWRDWLDRPAPLFPEGPWTPGVPLPGLPVFPLRPTPWLDRESWGLVDTWRGRFETLEFTSEMGSFNIPFTRQAFGEMLTAHQAPGPLGKAFYGVGMATDGLRVYDAVQNGDFGSATTTGIGMAINTVALTNPYVAAGKVSWDLGWQIGEFAGERLSDATADHIIHDAVVDRYGTSDPSATQMAEFSHRYDGAGGFLNYAGDSGKSAWKSLGNFLAGH